LFRFQRFVHTAAFFVCACLSYAHAEPLLQQPAAPSVPQISVTWLSALWNLPILQFLSPLFQSTAEPLPASPAAPAEETLAPAEPPPVEACAVEPLDAIDDPAAQELEATLGSGIDIDGMTRAAAAALEHFQSNVTAAGGSIILKSAFRPAAYQQHLQNVWYKWMRKLRDNEDPACQELRAQVQEEFKRHHLIETQHPVTVSDHTRGLAFDATVELPSKAKLGRRRVNVDILAA